ncbi:hypothetical protein [Amycolatopsis sp. NBC_00438]
MSIRSRSPVLLYAHRGVVIGIGDCAHTRHGRLVVIRLGIHGR